jgi:peptide deformylase
MKKRYLLIFCMLQYILCSEEAFMSIFIPPGDPSLRSSAASINIEDIVSEELQSIIDHMMDIAKGNQVDVGNGVMVGLAAPQIGIMKRIIIVDCGVDDDRKSLGHLVPYINPQIIWHSDVILRGPEGCYSVDEHLDGIIPRFESVQITAYDREGNFVDRIFSGFTARIFQHEIDHLNGIRFPDRVGENGILHWIPDGQYNQYLEHWEDWTMIFPFELWLDMKQGRPCKYSPA